MTKSTQLSDLVRVRKATQCATCKSYIYSVPVPVDAELANHLAIFGQPTYDITKYRLFVIGSDAISIRTSVGSTDISVKYISDYEGMSALFRIRLGQWLETHRPPAPANTSGVLSSNDNSGE